MPVWKIMTVVGLVFIVWASSYPLLRWLLPDKEPNLIGDSFGTVNALFSGLALAGLVFAIYLQQKELEDTRKELKGQKIALDSQVTTLQRQNFENTFFQLLKLQADIVNAIDLDIGNERHRKGRDCFRTFYWHLERAYNRLGLSADPKGTAISAYLAVYKTYEGDLGHYFRSLYHIIKFVHESPEATDKRRYTNFVRAQLSSNELAMLFYNGLSPLGAEKMKPLIERYALLKNLSKERLLSPTHIEFYAPTAFAGSGSTDPGAWEAASVTLEDLGLTS
jgi:hypothetical protein